LYIGLFTFLQYLAVPWIVAGG